MRIFKYDVNGNGIVETGDKVYAVFGFGRGGSAYYALDITSRTKPRFLWKKTSTELPMLGQAWSAPVITRVNVNSHSQTDAQKFVVIFGAGYDASQDNYIVHHGRRRQRHLHAGARHRQPAVERGLADLDRQLQASVHEELDPVGNHGARPERRQLRRPHVLR